MKPPESRHRNDQRLHNGKSDKSAISTRNGLALLVAALVATISLVAAIQNGAMPVLDKILPLLTLAFGFYFGQQSGRF